MYNHALSLTIEAKRYRNLIRGLCTEKSCVLWSRKQTKKEVSCDCLSTSTIFCFSFICSENLAVLCILNYFETEVTRKQRQNLNDVPLNTYLPTLPGKGLL